MGLLFLHPIQVQGRALLQDTTNLTPMGEPIVIPDTTAMLAQEPTSNGTTRQQQLEPFQSIWICAPLNVKIAPSNSSNTTSSNAYESVVEVFDTSMNRSEAVLNAIQTVVQNGQLYVSTMGDFETNATIQITIRLPSDALMALHHNGPHAGVYVAPGFDVEKMNVTMGHGAAQLFVHNATVGEVNVAMGGIAGAVLMGDFNTVNVVSDAIGTLYVGTVMQQVRVDLSGLSNVVVHQAPGSTINGVASGLGNVVYDNGICDVTSSWAQFSPFPPPVCFKRDVVDLPVPMPYWTCGIKVQGNFTCAANQAMGIADITVDAGGVRAAPPAAVQQQQTNSGGMASGSAQASGENSRAISTTTVNGVTKTVVADGSGSSTNTVSSNITIQHGVALLQPGADAYSAIAVFTQCDADQKSHWKMQLA